MRHDVARLLHAAEKLPRDDPLFQRAEADARRQARKPQQQPAEVGLPVPIGRDVDARQNDLAGGDVFRLAHDRVRGARTRAPPQVRDQTIGTEAVAAVLNAQKRAGLGLFGRGKLAERALFLQKYALPIEQFQNAVLMHRARDERDALALRKGFGVILRGASAYDDARRGIELSDAGNRLTALFFRLRRDGTGIDEVQIGIAEFVRHLVAARFERGEVGSALHLVDLAPQRENAGLHPSSPASCMMTETSAIAAVSARRMRFPSDTPQ